jgi:hypothetical protein
MAITGQTVVRDALVEIGAVGLTEAIGADDAVYALSKLQRITDNFNAEREAVFTVDFLSFLLIPSNGAPTIGPTGNWAVDTVTSRPVAQRPNVILGANVVLNNVSPNVRVPVNIRDAQWWLMNPVRGINTTFPTDLYYQPYWPNGTVNLWPVPSNAYGFEVETPIVLSAFALTTVFSMPPGYQDAITLTLAEDLQGANGRQPLPLLSEKAQQARARAFSNNYETPRLQTRDSGIPIARSTNETTYNYRSGLFQP